LKTGGAAVIFELFADYGMNWTQSSQLFGVLNTSGKTFALKSATVYIEQEKLVLQTSSARDASRLFKSVAEIRVAELFDSKNIEFSQIQKTTQVASLDLSKVDWPVVWRPWEQGDFIRPIGMGGRKKLVSDVLINAKVGLSKKQELFVLEMAGEVIWIPSIKSSESVKASAESSEIIQLAIHQ
jgi:tRNA(Ile)-lysidine synthase